jgi:hypothetical protein
LAAGGAERMHSVPQWRGMKFGLDPKVGPKGIHAVWVGTRRSDTEKSMPCGRSGRKKSMQCGLDPKVGHREVHAFGALKSIPTFALLLPREPLIDRACPLVVPRRKPR